MHVQRRPTFAKEIKSLKEVQHVEKHRPRSRYMCSVHFLILVGPFERTFDLDGVVLEVCMCKDTTRFVNFTNDGISNGTLVFNWIAVIREQKELNQTLYNAPGPSFAIMSSVRD